MSWHSVEAQATQRPDSDDQATFRDDFLNAVFHLHLGKDQTVALVEASSGKPFAACTAGDLLPVLESLLALVQRTNPCMHGSGACGE
jgi:hypothetical protein